MNLTNTFRTLKKCLILICSFLFISSLFNSSQLSCKPQRATSDKAIINKKNQSDPKSTKKDQPNNTQPSNILMPYGIEVNATHALLICCDTDEILLEKNANEKIAPASMTKMMTAYIIMNGLKNKEYKQTDLVEVPEEARQIEGSDMFLEPGDKVPLLDLLKGLIVVSGNDAAITLANFHSAGQQSFAAQMSASAKKLGCKNTNFKNASGLPEQDHYSTAFDLAIIAKHLIYDFPDLYGLHAVKEYTYNNITQANRNLLLKQFVGCDGVKTGFAKECGYGMVATVKRDGLRLLLVISGLKSAKMRAKEAKKILDWGFSHFENVPVSSLLSTPIMMPVRYGTTNFAELKPNAKDLITIERHKNKDLEISFKLPTIVEAPIKENQQLGLMIIKSSTSKMVKTFPLLATSKIERCNYFKQIYQYLFG